MMYALEFWKGLLCRAFLSLARFEGLLGCDDVCKEMIARVKVNSECERGDAGVRGNANERVG